MTAERKVMWVEGLLLSQQHFQQWEHYYEQQHTCYEATIHPSHWGLIRLQCDETALKQGQYRLLHCQAILPNRQYINYRDKQDDYLAYDLTKHPSHTVRVYLSIANTEQINGVSGYPKPTQTSTWLADYQQVSDRYDNKRQREVLFGRLNFLLTSNTEKQTMNSIAIAECSYQGEGQYRLNPDFIPPVLTIHASATLSHWLTSLLNDIQAEIVTLQDKLVFDQQLKIALSLQELKQCATLLKHCHQSCSHPETVYTCLITMLSRLHALDCTNSELILPDYQQHDLTMTFRMLNNNIKQLLSTINSSNRLFSCRMFNDHLHLFENIDKQLLKTSRWILIVQYDFQKQTAIHYFQQQVKVAAPSSIDQIINSALSAIPLTQQSPPDDINTHQKTCTYFHLNSEHENWKQVQDEQALAIFLPQPWQNAKLQLLAIQHA